VHPLRSAAEAALLRGELAEGCVPEQLVRRLERATDGVAEEAGHVAAEVAAGVVGATRGIILSRSDDPALVSRVAAALPRPVTG